MNIKAILSCATLVVAGAVGAQAQTNPVYSVNVVGYHKVVLPTGFTMIANQVNGTNNTLGALFPAPPGGTRFYKFTGATFTTYEYFTAFNAWLPDGNVQLGLGEGGFIYNPSTAFTNTFAGEVAVGSTTNPLLAGFSIKSSVLPQGGGVTTTLELPPSGGDRVYKFNGASYDVYEYFSAFNAWLPSEPSMGVGESFFLFKSSSGNWIRTFAVN